MSKSEISKTGRAFSSKSQKTIHNRQFKVDIVFPIYPASLEMISKIIFSKCFVYSSMCLLIYTHKQNVHFTDGHKIKRTRILVCSVLDKLHICELVVGG